MHITQESTGELTAAIQVKVTEDDYLENVNKQLKERQRKAVLPGFRPGKVPFGHIKKMYGLALTLDEVNKVVSEKLMAYITDNHLPVLGYPIPDQNKANQIDWQNQTEFVLIYNVGLAPEFDLKFSEEIEVDYYKINADEDQINTQIEEFTKRYGSETAAEISEADDLIKGKIVKINDDNSPAEGVEPIESVIYPKQLGNIEHQTRFVGLKPGDSVEFDLREYFPNKKDVVKILQLKEKEAEEAKGMYRFTVEEISHLVPAEPNEEFFKKIFPEIEDIDETKFRELIKTGIENQYIPESDKKFLQDAIKKILEANTFALPEDFIRTWVFDRNNGKNSKEEIEKQFPDIMTNLRWDLIRNKISDKYRLHVSENDLRDYLRNYFIQRFGIIVNEDPERLEKYIDEALKKQKDAEKIEEEILARRMITVTKEVLKPRIKEVSLMEFVQMSVSMQKHEHVHDEHCNHDHDHDHTHSDEQH